MLRILFENQGLDTLLTLAVVERGAQQREAPSLSVHRVLPRRQRDVPTGARSTLPNRKSNQLQTLKRPAGEVELNVCEFPPGGLPLSFGIILTVILSLPAQSAIRDGSTRSVPGRTRSVCHVLAQDVLECDQRVIAFWDSESSTGTRGASSGLTTLPR
jgi:hypothetical protein